MGRVDWHSKNSCLVSWCYNNSSKITRYINHGMLAVFVGCTILTVHFLPHWQSPSVWFPALEQLHSYCLSFTGATIMMSIRSLSRRAMLVGGLVLLLSSIAAAIPQKYSKPPPHRLPWDLMKCRREINPQEAGNYWNNPGWEQMGTWADRPPNKFDKRTSEYSSLQLNLTMPLK